MRTRDEYLRSMFNTSGFGLEIGPSYNPLLSKAMGYNVETLDHASAIDLRLKYADMPEAITRIEDVNFISDGRAMSDVIGKMNCYDYIFASHVIEHIPNIIGFLNDCSRLLKPDGKLILAVPDKRYCFDLLRPLSTIGQAIEAHILKHTRHSLATLFDHTSYFALKNGAFVWIEPGLDSVTLPHSLSQAYDLAILAEKSSDYFDAHAWRFTPKSFSYFTRALHELKLHDLTIEHLSKYDGPTFKHEFYVVMTKSITLHEVIFDRANALKEIEHEWLEVTNPTKSHFEPQVDPSELFGAQNLTGSAWEKVAEVTHQGAMFRQDQDGQQAAQLSFEEALTRMAQVADMVLRDRWWRRTRALRRWSNSFSKLRGRPKKHWPKHFDPFHSEKSELKFSYAFNCFEYFLLLLMSKMSFLYSENTSSRFARSLEKRRLRFKSKD